MSNTSPTAEILSWPRVNPFGSTTDPVEMSRRVLEMKKTAIRDAIDFLVPPLFEAISSVGFTNNDDRKKSLLVGLLQAIMCDHYGISHPLNNFIEHHSKELSLIIDSVGER